MIKKSDFLLFLLIIFMALAGVLAYLGSIGGEGDSSGIGGGTNGVPSVVPVISDSRETVQLPILMYHGVTDDASAAGEYTISAETFEQDLEWLGNNGFTTVSVKQLTDYVENGDALPDKPVLITFDDGYANNYTLAFPLLRKYHMNAVISIIGSEVDTSSDDIYRKMSNSSLSWGEVALLASSGNIEIGNHTYDLHKTSNERKGANIKKGESPKEYEKTLKEDLSALQQKVSAVTGKEPLLFAWPYGEYPADRSADPILKELGFKVSVTSYQKMNVIEQGEPDCLFGLKRFLRTPDFDMSKILG